MVWFFNWGKSGMSLRCVNWNTPAFSSRKELDLCPKAASKRKRELGVVAAGRLGNRSLHVLPSELNIYEGLLQVNGNSGTLSLPIMSRTIGSGKQVQ